jgi:exocyst complex component 8
MMSACVKWAKEEVEAFNAILARQLSSTDPAGETWKTCMERAQLHAKMLSDVGLDFRNLVGRDLQDSTVGSGSPIGLGLS